MEVSDELDKEFILLTMEIEKRYDKLNKHMRLKCEAWIKKLCQVTNNKEWKKNRNLHVICLLDMILNMNIEAPYNKFPPDGAVPIISKALVKAKLSNKFHEMTAVHNNIEPREKDMNIINKDDNETPVMIQKNESKTKGFNDQNINLQESQIDYQKELDSLRNMMSKLRGDLKMKDELIKRQNDEKRNLEKRIAELEKIVENLLKLNDK